MAERDPNQVTVTGVQALYDDALKACSRSVDRRFNQRQPTKVFVRFKEKVVIPAGGNGVFASFASGGIKHVRFK
jgi:hypothetical protein